MHIHFLDPYRLLPSPIHALDGRVKFVLTVAFILTSALTPVGAWPIYLVLWALIWAVAVLSQLGIGFVTSRAVLAMPFVLAALPLLFSVPGQPLLSLGGLTLTAEGLTRFLSLALKSWLSLQAAILLTTTTPFPDLLLAMRAVRLPRLLVALFGLMWRYIFVLADEALRLMRAREARSGGWPAADRPQGGTLVWRAKVTGGMAGNLFLRGLERSDRIYLAMLARGYDGEIRSLPQPPLSRAAWLALAGGLGVLIVLLFLSLLWA